MLDPEKREAWERDGYFIVRRFGAPESCRAMHARAVEIAREGNGVGLVGAALIQPEAKENPAATTPDERVSKIFKLHREEPVFRSFIHDEAVLELGSELIGSDLDCFLSQFIFKNAGALGQPWHQDSFYFPFDCAPQVGIWLAVTEATLHNGCLYVLPGSHKEPVHKHVKDRRPGANHGYVEIVDHDMSAAVPVEMAAGDLLVFHSHLMHCSKDNESDRLRAAMVYHLAEAGTVDRAENPAAINDWLPVRRTIATSIDIEAASDDVWQVLCDGSRYGEWNPYIVKVEGSIEAGTSIVCHGRSPDGSLMPMPVEVVRVEHPCMRWQGGLPDRALFRGDHVFELEDLGDHRTRFHHYEHFTGQWVGEIVVARSETIRGNFERMNEGLRSHFESG